METPKTYPPHKDPVRQTNKKIKPSKHQTPTKIQANILNHHHINKNKKIETKNKIRKKLKTKA